jgi:hypothetical protein
MRVKLLIDCPGGLGGLDRVYQDARRGQIVDLAEHAALGYVSSGLAQADLTGPPGIPYKKPAT